MGITEIAVWSAMTGGLLTLAALALADALVNRSRGSMRNLVFVLVTGTGCVVMTGLTEILWPWIPDRLEMLLKASLGPLGGAIALYYLGIWLGGISEDVIVHRISAWGGVSLFFASLVLAFMVVGVSEEEFHQLLIATAVVNMAAAVMGLIICVRAAAMGDPLARWMVLACVALVLLVAGLYLRGLNVPGFGLGTWVVTALLTVGYFLACIVLVIMRTRQLRHLTRLANLQKGADPATNLPTGSVLLSDVTHAFWRTARFHGECTVVCLNLHNLYELGEKAGHAVDQQILAAMAARIRRAAGFRCVVGLYHPRCFVVVISADKRRDLVNQTITRLRSMVGRPLVVVGRDQHRHEYTPQLGLGIVTVDPSQVEPIKALADAERQALATVRESVQKTEDAIVTAPAPL